MPNQPSHLEGLICHLRRQADTEPESDSDRRWKPSSNLDITRPFCLSSFPLSEDRRFTFFTKKKKREVECSLALGIMVILKAAKLRASSVPGASYALFLIPTGSCRLSGFVPCLPPLCLHTQSAPPSRGARLLSRQAETLNQVCRVWIGYFQRRDARTELDSVV